MNFTDYITNHGKRVNKQAFIHLVQISKIDGKIQKDELELLHKEGRKFGLTDPEIEHLIASEKESHYHAPYSLEDKFNHLYEMAEMILADEVVKERERKMMEKFAIEAGFSDGSIERLIPFLLDGVSNNKSEEALFEEFRKKHLFID